ncbi:MAG: ribonuclease HI family protein [Candidatus Omnitrophota bacterium]|jgi:ribonuclease HI
MKTLEIYIDGASKGNPGPSGVGIVICRDGSTVKNISSYIGNTTNNVAEYTALIYALEEALMMKAENLKINTDSQLLHRQLKGIYKVRHPNMIPLHERAKYLLSGFKEVVIHNIPRSKNCGADKLATEAVKKQYGKHALC